MFNAMNEKELFEVSGGLYYVPYYNEYGFYCGTTAVSKPGIKYVKKEYRPGGYQYIEHYN